MKESTEHVSLASQTTQDSEAPVSELREMYFSLISDLRIRRKLRARSGYPTVASLLKSDFKKRLHVNIESLSATLPSTEILSLLEDFGEGLSEVLGAEIPTINVKDEFQHWVGEATTLLCGIGIEMQSICEEFLPARPDLEQRFKLALLEKTNKFFAERFSSPSGRNECRIRQRKKGDWLEAKPPADDPKMKEMSLDQLVDFITDVQKEPPPVENDDVNQEILKFRRRLETCPSPCCRVTPSLSASFLSRLIERSKSSPN